MSRPLPIMILAALAILNGVGAWLMAGLAWAGSDLVWKAQGAGPSRIPLADLFGPFRDDTAWVLAAIGATLLALGAGLFLLKPWARWVTIALVGGSALGTLVAIGWGIRHRHMGVVAAGLVKAAGEIALCYYLLMHVRVAFVAGGRR